HFQQGFALHPPGGDNLLLDLHNNFLIFKCDCPDNGGEAVDVCWKLLLLLSSIPGRSSSHGNYNTTDTGCLFDKS
ncbi:hypothetical protein, partial [Candidatus Magnetaquicoccus inordinatus]|uniref:hypothetical protein n=1 Tax=Candidatus Magnetaquicoccus inordinatus TaxID=2496818 RepID=UPI001D0E2C88